MIFPPQALLAALAVAVCSALAADTAPAWAQEPTSQEPALKEASPQPPLPPDPELDVYFHADLDGALATPRCETVAGSSSPAEPADYAGLLRGLAEARGTNAGRSSLVLLGPNAVAPDLFTRRLFARDATAAAATVAELFSHAGYAAFALGSHELAWNPSWSEAYVGAMAKAGVHPAPANVTCNDAAQKARPRVCEALTARPVLVSVPELGSVGIVAAFSPRLWAGLASDRRSGLTVVDAAAHLKKASEEARRAGATIVVAMVDVPRGREGLDELRGWETALAAKGGPDLLLAAGLSDDEGARTLRLLRQDAGPPLAGSTTGARSWTRVGLTVPQARDERAQLLSVETVAARSTIEGSVATSLKAWVDDYCAVYGQALGAGANEPLGYEGFVTYVLEVMRRRANAEIALINRRFVKTAPFPWAGKVSEGDWAQALPYPAALGVVTLTGAQVKSLLGGARSSPRLSFAGMTKDGPLLVNGRDVDATRYYRVATIGFLAEGGDELFEAGALPWKPLPDAPDLPSLVRDFLLHDAGEEDGDPRVSLATDFGPPPAVRPLVVGLTDLDLGLTNTSVTNGAHYSDAQLTRSAQRTFKGEWNSVMTFRAPEEDMDGRIRLQYGWTRTQPPEKPAVSSESLDLISGTFTYNDRRLRKVWHPPAWIAPDPYARLFVESEFTRPAVTTTQTRTYHHAELTATLGASFKPLPKLRLRLGPGGRRELLAPGAAGQWRFALEAGATLEPTAIATVGPLPVRLEGTADYFYLEPTGAHAQQLRANARLSFPLLPTLFLTAGVEIYGAQYAAGPWQFATDTTVALRVHFDRAYQSM